jgi:hypothetical protein
MMTALHSECSVTILRSDLLLTMFEKPRSVLTKITTAEEGREQKTAKIDQMLIQSNGLGIPSVIWFKNYLHNAALQNLLSI